jgi:hypothetical protein
MLAKHVMTLIIQLIAPNVTLYVVFKTLYLFFVVIQVIVPRQANRKSWVSGQIRACLFVV